MTFDKISDRQDLIGYMQARKLGLEPYMYDRTDMYWAHVHVTDDGLVAKLSYCIDSPRSFPAAWSLSLQYGSKLLDTEKLRAKVLLRWANSTERVKADGWMKNLADAGYFDHGWCWAPNANVGKCPQCGHTFEKGTSHPHTWLKDWNHKGEKRLIHHHKLLEKKIKELGLTKSGVSGLPDVPSLEELGELEPVTIA